jgi:hypothetical protein
MSLRLIRAAAELDQSDDLHLGRLLILLGSSDTRGKRDTAAKPIAGIMKLAKMDFLLRYPTSLERVMKKKGGDPSLVAVSARERNSIEASMIRFRYGPWDKRYRRWLSILRAQGLIEVGVRGRTVEIALTNRGRQVAETLKGIEEFSDLVRRSQLVVKTVGGMNATKLKEFVYEAIPEIVDMKWGQEITP